MLHQDKLHLNIQNKWVGTVGLPAMVFTAGDRVSTP